jgi:lysophospholipase L1-like esterase
VARRARLRRRLRWALGLGGFCAVLVILEVGVRLGVPLHPKGWFVAGPSEDRYFVPAPNLSYTWGESTFVHGPLGTPQGAALPAGDGRRRVAFLGDSVCYGFFASGNENLARRVEASLGSERVETLNFGVPGYNAHMVSATLREQALEFGPDAVIYVFHQNDLTNASHADAFRARPALFRERYDPPSSLARRILTRSRALTFAMDRIRKSSSGRAAPRGGSPAPSAARAETYSPWATTLRAMLLEEGRHRRHFVEHLRAMQGACAGRKIPFALLFVPRRESLSLDGQGEYRDALAGICQAEGVTFLDGQAAFAALGEADLYGDPGHPNGQGHAALAEAALPWLRARLELP